MVTLILMGGSTFAIGLVPTYETIRLLAPTVVLVLRLLQGLTTGDEYGGVATYVAEHAPVSERGFWTTWLQTTAVIAFVISPGVIMGTKNQMDNGQRGSLLDRVERPLVLGCLRWEFPN